MEILVTHLGTDLDALAATLAAQKLHPGARLFFPGSHGEAVRRLLSSGLLGNLPEVAAGEVDPQTLTRLIVVDVRQPRRLGAAAGWLAANPGIEVWAYDHHPDADGDVPVSGGVVDPAAGSCSTILAELLEERGLPLSDVEASLLLCGLFEDTGSLTYATVGPRDFAAAAWLLGQGGDLALVRRFAVHSLDREHLGLLSRLLADLEIHPLAGHRVGVALLELPEYVEDVAPLVSRALEISGLSLLFALVSEADRARVTIIGRGDLPGFHLGDALAALGGGGHATAGSASVKGETALAVRESLLALLARNLPPAARARDLMISPVFTLPSALPVAAAKEQLLARAIHAAPVVGEDGRVVGVVTRQALDAALQHGWGEREVAVVMYPEVAWIAPDDPASRVGEKLLGLPPRFALVGDALDGRPLGLVTRMGLLRHLAADAAVELGAVGGPLDRRHAQARAVHERLSRRLARRLPPALRHRLDSAARVSERLGIPVYAVGGFVRDLLLERDNRDLDLLVEGDGPAFAGALAAELGGELRVHAAFLTAEILLPGGETLDVATARSELYRSPAALPEVQSSALRQDLFRRDFTVNTLALRLGPGGPPELVDFFGGRRDLENRQLRVLHSLSFVDDPTRALRGVRLEARLQFRLAAETEKLLAVALSQGVFDLLTGSRLAAELELLLGDPGTALAGLDRLAELGLLPVLHPRLTWTPALAGELRGAQAAYDWYRLEGLTRPAVSLFRLLLLVLARSLPDDQERERLCRRLLLAGEVRAVVMAPAERLGQAAGVAESAANRPHEVEEALAGLSGEEVLLLFAAASEEARARVRHALTDLAPRTLAVRGADLVARGVAAGPAVGRALRETRRALLDGRVGEGREEQLAFALAVLAGAGAFPSGPSPETGEGNPLAEGRRP